MGLGSEVLALFSACRTGLGAIREGQSNIGGLRPALR